MDRAISGHNLDFRTSVTFPCLTQTRDISFDMPEHLVFRTVPAQVQISVIYLLDPLWVRGEIKTEF